MLKNETTFVPPFILSGDGEGVYKITMHRCGNFAFSLKERLTTENKMEKKLQMSYQLKLLTLN